MDTNRPQIAVTREGPVTIITIDRPERRNALGTQTQAEMRQAFDAFAADDAQWIAIVTGAGDKAFCAGLDLREQSEATELVSPPLGFGGLTGRFDLNKPVIAAVNGVAMGGGFELALATDIIIAARGVTFALPEPRVGLAALGGGLQRLARSVGYHRAMALMLTGRPIGAEEAMELGIVAEVTDEPVLDVARRWADQILACSPMAVRATKEAILRGIEEPLATAFDAQWTYPAMKAMLTSQDMREGPAAFAEKRPPAWTGR